MRIINKINRFKCGNSPLIDFIKDLTEYVVQCDGKLNKQVSNELCSLFDSECVLYSDEFALSLLTLTSFYSEDIDESVRCERVKEFTSALVALYLKAGELPEVGIVCIYILEFIVKSHSAEESINLFEHIFSISKNPVRTIIPYGFYYLYRESVDDDVKLICLKRLKEMAFSGEKEIMSEANFFLSQNSIRQNK